MATVMDASFEKLIDPDVQTEKIAGGFQFTEGPVWNSKENRLIFSDIQGDTMYVWAKEKGCEVFRKPSGQANGNTYDRRGRLITCEHENRRISRTMSDGKVETLVSHYTGKRLNSPNDVVCSSKGDVYFSDPPYGLRQSDGTFKKGELEFNGVYRFSPRDGCLTLLIDDFIRPNGLLLNKDETKLFIDDSELHHVRVFDISVDGTLQNGRVFAELKYENLEGRPDGMKIDTEGNLYVAGGITGRIWVFNPEGKLIGFIEFEEAPANLAWGGEDWRIMFVTAETSVYRVSMKVAGLPAGPRHLKR